MTLNTAVRVLCASFALWGSPGLCGQGEIQGTFLPPGRLPTHAPPGAVYLGPSACSQCHPAEAATQQSTAMANTLQAAADSPILRSHPRLEFKSGGYFYQIVRENNNLVYRVTDGVETISEPLLWALGLGEAGQTYVYKHKGDYYESRVSFYNDIRGLDFTIGAMRPGPTALEEGAGWKMSPARVRDCFGCHSTGAVRESRLTIHLLIPGITCEGCHGAGGKHVAAIQAGNEKEARKQIFDPGKLSTEQLSEFCGSCHGTFSRVVESRISGISNVRFQPYRLSNSRCYNPDDRRISCVACHNPHKQVEREPLSYDSKCLACHAPLSRKTGTEERRSAACPVATYRCVTCHMPKNEIPGSHFNFTDHWIRVVRANEHYPD